MFIKVSMLSHLSASFGPLMFSWGRVLQNQYLPSLWPAWRYTTSLTSLLQQVQFYFPPFIQLKILLMECVFNFPKDELYMLSKLTAPEKGSDYGSHLRTTAVKTEVQGVHNRMPASPCSYHSRSGAFHWKCSWRWSLYAPWPIIIIGAELPKAKSSRSCLILCPWPNHHQWGMLENQWEELKGVIVESFQRSSIHW